MTPHRVIRIPPVSFAFTLLMIAGAIGVASGEPLDPASHPGLTLAERLAVSRRHARDAWRPAVDRSAHAAVRVAIEGEVIRLTADAGEFDGDWSDPAVVQRALFTVIEGLRRAEPTLDPHFIVVVSTFLVDAPIALYLPLANDVRGIGYRHLEPAEVFRFTPGRLDGVVFMNAVRLAETPLATALFLQEIGHRWGVYVRLPEPDGTRLLGRDCAHWSAWVTTAGSAMEGNPWVEQSPGRFVARVPDRVGYGAAEHYLMGLLPAAEVAPSAIVSSTGWPCFEPRRMGVANPRHDAPTWRSGMAAAVDGQVERIQWDAVVANEGPRDPDHTVARRRWSAVFVLVTNAADDPTEALPIVDRVRSRWASAFEAAATLEGGVGLQLETALAGARLVNEPGSVGLGGRCLDALDCAAAWPRCVGTATGDRVCSGPCEDHAGCGDGACCVALAPGDAVCLPSMDACPAVDVGRDAGQPDGGVVDGGEDGGLPDGAAPIEDASAPLAEPRPERTHGPSGCAVTRAPPTGSGRSPWGALGLGLASLAVARRRRRDPTRQSPAARAAIRERLATSFSSAARWSDSR